MPVTRRTREAWVSRELADDRSVAIGVLVVVDAGDERVAYPRPEALILVTEEKGAPSRLRLSAADA